LNSATVIDLISDGTGLLGSVALVRPALRVNRLSRLRARVARLTVSQGDDPTIAMMKSETERHLETAEKSWSHLDQACLFGGLGFVIFSFAIKIVWNAAFAP
jgi:PIN domain nuclease of toxin-antitoxin system